MEPNKQVEQEHPKEAQDLAHPQKDDGLQQWWSSWESRHKQLLELNSEGELLLKPHSSYPERLLSQLHTQHADATISALESKFEEVEAKVKDFAKEWEEQEDKVKLSGKLSRLNDYLLHVKAIGDFPTIHNQLELWKKEMVTLGEEHKAKKEALVQKAEALQYSQEWKEGTQQFKEFTEEWRKAGAVEKEENEELYQRFEAAKNHFFEEKRKAHEQKEEEMLQNLDLKLELVNKSEELSSSQEWKKTTERFKELMEEWKKIGQTFHDKNEELWQRFIAAKNKFFDSKKENFLHIQQEQEHNLEQKLQLITQAEEMKESEEWNKTSAAYAELMEKWKKIGRVPLEKADEIWQQLSAAKDYFFERKRLHFQTVKVNLEDNLAQKTALVNRSEQLKDSTQWRETTDELNEMMEEWKHIGPVPRAYNNELWERFLSARKHFFKRKDADRDKRKARIAIQREVQNKQAAQTLIHAEENLKEEKNKLIDFEEALQNITPGPKAQELKTHLENLILETKSKIEKMIEKVHVLRSRHSAKENTNTPTTDTDKPSEESSTTD